MENISLSTLALIQAQQAREEACNAVISSFDSKTSTVAQKRVYAECVDFIYPVHSPEEILVAKIFFVVALLSAGYGLLYEYREGDGDFWGYFVSAGAFFVCVPLFLALIALVGYGVYWLFT